MCLCLNSHELQEGKSVAAVLGKAPRSSIMPPALLHVPSAAGNTTGLKADPLSSPTPSCRITQTVSNDRGSKCV